VPLNNRVVSMNLEQLHHVDRAVTVACGARKYQAILGISRGKWMSVLITDGCVAQRLIHEA
jgi:DNA-binding transcriptional regulator LsrR (DeoR family)